MFHWRVSKYNPSHRNTSGSYQKNEWTSFSDIGKIFDDEKLTFDDYLPLEDAYIQAIIGFMECNQTDTMRIASLEKHALPQDVSLYSKLMLDIFENIANKMIVDKETIKSVGRLALREDLWCKLEAKNMRIHFGYDYYLYIGSKSACSGTIAQIESTGLFVEEYDLPL